jgi:hypothetical protein
MPEKDTRRNVASPSGYKSGKTAATGSSRNSTSHGALKYGTQDDARSLATMMKESLQSGSQRFSRWSSMERKPWSKGKALMENPPDVITQEIKGRISRDYILGMIASEGMLSIKRGS